MVISNYIEKMENILQDLVHFGSCKAVVFITRKRTNKKGNVLPEKQNNQLGINRKKLANIHTGKNVITSLTDSEQNHNIPSENRMELLLWVNFKSKEHTVCI